MSELLKILTYVARPEGLGLYGPILDMLIPEMFSNDTLYESAEQGNMWATKTLFSESIADRKLRVDLMFHIISQNRINQAKFILNCIFVQNADEILNVESRHLFDYTMLKCIERDFKDMIKILLDMVPLGRYELGKYMGLASYHNKAEIVEIFIKKGIINWFECILNVIMNENIKLLEILIIELLKTPNISRTMDLDHCLQVADNCRRYAQLKCILDCLPNDYKLIDGIYKNSRWHGPSREIFEEKLAFIKNLIN